MKINLGNSAVFLNGQRTAKSIIYSAIVITALPLTVSAQTKKLTLEECIDMALNNGLSMKSGRIAVQRADDLKGTAFDPGQTAVTLGQETGGGGPDNAITVSQDFEFPTVYVARHKALKAEADLERSNLNMTRNESVRDVTSCYYETVYAGHIMRLCEVQDSILRQNLNAINIKHSQGSAGRLEQINAEHTCRKSAIELKKAKDNYKAQLLSLQDILQSPVEVVPADNEFNAIPFDVMPTAVVDFSATPQGELTRNQVTLSERNLSVARQEFMPGLTVAATTQLFIKGFNPYHVDRQRFKEGNFLGFEVGVTVPLFFGAQRARTRAAKRDLELAKTAQVQAETELKREYRNSLDRYATAKSSLDYYATTALSRAEEIEKLSSEALSRGEIDYNEHVANVENAIEIRIEHANAVNEYNQCVIQLKYLQGAI